MNSARLTVVGAGNVGFWTACALALTLKHAGAARSAEVHVVDFDDVDATAVGKGYPALTLGQPKVTALVATLMAWFGADVAAAFRPHRAAIESVPGLLDGADVFCCVDSYRTSAFIGERARRGWQVRLTTAEGRTAASAVEVFPPGTTTVAALFDAAAWQAAEARSCVLGTPRDLFAGRPQPTGLVAASLAVQAWLARHQEPHAYRLTLDGARPLRAEIPSPLEALPPRRVLPVAADAPLRAVFESAAAALDAPGAADDDRLLVVFDSPLALRSCGCTRGVTVAFERVPVAARCAACGEPSVLVGLRRDWRLSEMGAVADEPLAALAAPAGLGLSVSLPDGRALDLALPFAAEAPESPTPRAVAGAGGGAA